MRRPVKKNDFKKSLTIQEQIQWFTREICAKSLEQVDMNPDGYPSCIPFLSRAGQLHPVVKTGNF